MLIPRSGLRSKPCSKTRKRRTKHHWMMCRSRHWIKLSGETSAIWLKMRRPEIVWPYLWATFAILLLSFALRVYHLGQSSLRGDEAFAIRYWAQSPDVVLTTRAD